MERPFRSGPLKLSGRRLFLPAASMMLIFVAAGSAILISGGIPSRFTPQAVQVASSLGRTDMEHALTRFPVCFIDPESSYRQYNSEVCLHRDPAKTKTYLLAGDSHAAVLWNALAESLPDTNILQPTATPCKPYLHPPGSDDCKQLFRYIYESYLPSNPVQALILEGRWREDELSGLAETIAWAKSHQVPVMLFGNVPEHDEPLPRLLAYSIAWDRPELTAKHREPYSQPLDAKLQSLAANTWHVPYVSPYQAVCCPAARQEYADATHQLPLLTDDDHFSRQGALDVVQKVISEGTLR